MKKTIFTFLILFPLFFMACRSVRIEKLAQIDSNERLLPRLEAKFDIESFQDVYREVYETQADTTEGDDVYVYYDIPPLSPNNRHAKLLFEKEVNGGFTQNFGEAYGYAVCKKGLSDSGPKNLATAVVSVMTFGLLNLIGFPVGIVENEMELSVEIFDSNNKRIGSYAAFGYGQAAVAMYYGYNQRDANRLSFHKAFRNALDEIKTQIEADHDKLEAALMLAGPVEESRQSHKNLR